MFFVFYQFYKTRTPASTLASINTWLFNNNPVLRLKALKWISFFTHMGSVCRTNVVALSVYGVWPQTLFVFILGLVLFSAVICFI
jgi:hypothetical protein